jgi:uncharacterized protein YqjF (DUF2071 family)
MSTFLTAEWRKLIMAQYAVSPEVLAPWLPQGVELDLYDGQCFVSLVGFLFDRVRIKGVAVPFHTRFEEINLRFYVVRTLADGTRRRGVVFVREFVPRAAITLVAAKLYEEPYATLPTLSRISASPRSLDVEYSWKHRSQWHRLAVEASPQARPIAVGSVEEFITEHYWGYTKRSDGSTSEYPVQHPRWSVYPIAACRVEADFGALYGPSFAALTGQPAANVLLAEGSAVSVGSGSRFTT